MMSVMTRIGMCCINNGGHGGHESMGEGRAWEVDKVFLGSTVVYSPDVFNRQFTNESETDTPAIDLTQTAKLF